MAAAALGSNRLEKTTEAESRKIRGLIADLAKIDNPDFGLSPTLTGDAFAPIPASGHFGMGLLTYHGLKTNPAFKSLVELGPKALPLLLESLDNKTPTKLTLEHDGLNGVMSFGHEICGKFAEQTQAKVLADAQADACCFGGDHIDNYTVKVGDVCFVAIGQITNRDYNALRCQPTAYRHQQHGPR